MNNLLEQIRKIDPDCITVRKFDELLDEMKQKYHFNIENMKHDASADRLLPFNN